VSCYSVEFGNYICTVSQRRISMCRVALLSLEFIFVRSARGGFLCVVLQC